MNNTDDSSPLKSRGGVYVSYALMAVVLYFLSIGPAAWLNSKDYLSDQAGIIYYPIIYLHDNTFLKEPLEWYVELWVTNF